MRQRNILKIIFSTLAVLLLFTVSMSPMAIVAQAQDQSASSAITVIGEGTKLPGFDAGHPSQAYQAGASNITSAMFYVMDFLKYIIGSIAVGMIIISAMKLIFAGKQIDEVYPKQKEQIKYAIFGLIMIIIADSLVRQVLFGDAGEVYSTSSSLMAAGDRGNAQIRGIYTFIQFLVASVAVLFFVIAGIRLVFSSGNPDNLTKAKKQMLWSGVGLIIAGISEFVVKGIIFPDQGTRLPDLNAANHLIVRITNFASGFIATLSVIMLIYAGYLYVISIGGDKIEKAKKVITGAIIGILVSMAAFGFVNTFVKVEPLTNVPTTQIPEVTGNTGVTSTASNGQ